MSEAYFASPVAFGRPSRRGTRVPTIENFVEGSHGAGSPSSRTISFSLNSPLNPSRCFPFSVVISGLLRLERLGDALAYAGVVLETQAGNLERRADLEGIRPRSVSRRDPGGALDG